MQWLSETFDLELDTVRSLSIDSWAGRLVESENPRKYPVWLLRARSVGSWFGGGPVFCPQCLAEAPEPFFRIVWRFGAICACPIHGCELLDKCPECGAGVWPQGAFDTRRFQDREISLDQCTVCLTRLSLASASPADTPSLSAASALLEIYRSGQAKIADQLSVSASSYFSALGFVCELFLRQIPSRSIRHSTSSWADLAARIWENRFNQQPSHLHVQDRGALVRSVYSLFDDWPNSFIEFARQTRVSRVALARAGLPSSDWLLHAIRRVPLEFPDDVGNGNILHLGRRFGAHTLSSRREAADGEDEGLSHSAQHD